MATKRKSLSKKTRFEVFKRDSFKCQYCGACAPDVTLVVDHIDPISKDGADEMFNYITSCQPCNAGKSDRKLDDQTTLAKQKAQLDDLNERREQLEMLMQWRNGMKDIKETQIEALQAAWKAAAPGFSLNDKGLKELKGHLRKYPTNEIFEAIEIVGEKYIKTGEDGNAEKSSVELAWSKLGGVLYMKSAPDSERELHYIKGILKNRVYTPYNVLQMLEEAHEAGVSVQDMKREAKYARNWTAFRDWLDDAIEGARG